LSQLERGNPVDVSHLIYDIDVLDEICHNEQYIIEINEEINVIILYLQEVVQTKEYLEKQIDLMRDSRKVAFFPGKFHPPHIGHIQTLLTLLPNYKKLIIGVSEHMPEKAILTPDEIQKSLESFFKDYENVEVCRIKGVLIEKENLNGLPEFDVLLSGNEDVLEWAKKQGLKAKYITRSTGYLYSGTEIRTAFTDRETQ
jgi:nicotinamide mononucleotide adenylyltransferase